MHGAPFQYQLTSFEMFCSRMNRLELTQFVIIFEVDQSLCITSFYRMFDYVIV